MSKLIDITGQRFGRLTVIERAETRNGAVYWKCLCDCGEQRIVRGGKLKEGRTLSCGCYKSQALKRPNKYEIKEDYGICYFNNGGCFIFDVNDYERIRDYTWFRKSGNYVLTHIGDKLEYVHRLIMNCPKDKVIDHINHNPLDNRKQNLRICTKAENNHNVGEISTNTSGKKGVRLDGNNRWKATIGVNGKELYLGSFINKEDAIKVRIEAEKKYYGEFAYKGE